MPVPTTAPRMRHAARSELSHERIDRPYCGLTSRARFHWKQQEKTFASYCFPRATWENSPGLRWHAPLGRHERNVSLRWAKRAEHKEARSNGIAAVCEGVDEWLGFDTMQPSPSPEDNPIPLQQVPITPEGFCVRTEEVDDWMDRVVAALNVMTETMGVSRHVIYDEEDYWSSWVEYRFLGMLVATVEYGYVQYVEEKLWGYILGLMEAAPTAITPRPAPVTMKEVWPND